MEFFGTVKDGIIMLPAAQLTLQEQYLHSLKNDTPITIKYTKTGKSKSHQQVKSHFGLVVMMIREKMIKLGWGIFNIPPNKNMIHDILKRCCGGVGDGGEVLGLSEMTTVQASMFFENCRDWAATELKLYIPDPNKNWRENRGQ